MLTDKHLRILAAAKECFLRYGYKRVTMSDIAAAAEISRPALYLVFGNKEDVFRGVFRHWVDETIGEIERALPAHRSARQKIVTVFELWAVRSFEAVLRSTEARELVDCSLDFARDDLEAGYRRLDALLAPLVDPLLGTPRRKPHLSAARAAHVLTGSVRGFKQVATDAAELRAMIADLLSLWLDGSRP